MVHSTCLLLLYPIINRGWGFFLFTITTRPVLGPTQLPIQQVQGTLSKGVKWPGHKVDHSSPSSAKVKDA